VTHTPGPWSFSPQKGTRGHCYMAQVWGPDGNNLATIESTQDAEEATANARLISAAPDLLEAAKHAAMEWRLHGQLTDSCRELEAALAKAEGK